MHLSYLLSASALSPLIVASPVAPDQQDSKGVTIELRRGDHHGPFGKRATGTTAAANNKWWITLGLGTPAQSLNFLGDSAANAFSVLSSLGGGASNLGTDAILFDPTKSSTAKPMEGYTWEQCFSSNCFRGPMYKDSITIGGQVFTDIAFGLTTNTDNPVGNGDRSGNLGMSPSYDGQPTTPGGVQSFLQQISSRLPAGTVAYTYNWDLNTGAMDFGWIDTTKYTGNLVYKDTDQNDGSWRVQFDGIVVNGNFVSAPFGGGFDHGSSYSIFPKPILDAYFSHISGAAWNSDAHTYRFPCDASLPPFSLSFGGISLAVPKELWIGNPINDENICECAYTDSGADDNAYIGFTWLAGVYIVFDQDKLRVGLANRPALSTNVPSQPVAGSTKFCTGTGFSGDCVNAQWLSNTCGNLAGTKYYKNIGSLSPEQGYCTLYQDTGCASPLPYAAGIRSPGLANTYGSGPLAQAYACFYPSDYPIRGSGTFHICDQSGFRGNCQDISWSSFECHNLDDNFSGNFLSATPDPEGYCYLFTNQGCTGAVENGAPLVQGGPDSTPVGHKVKSFMCL